MYEKKTDLQRFIESEIRILKETAETWTPDMQSLSFIRQWIISSARDAHVVISYVFIYEDKIGSNEAEKFHSLIKNAEHNAIEVVCAINDRYNRKEGE